ncbi:MAG: PLP-dependent aminotransferase family protein [Alphaproteobacteria bacterium]|nr:PLP-dependent aminotransferase family protein [Alphaproteobacteria bacterium]
MTIFPKDIAGSLGPRYLAIADVIAAKIGAGALTPGERLPTHRDLAWRVGVTVGTVTRAYAELERRGLTVGEIGRGTFVRGPRPEDLAPQTAAQEHSIVDLSLNYPPKGPDGGDVAAVLRALAADPKVASVLDYQPHLGRDEHRAAGARWIARSGLHVGAEQVAITSGGQHGITVALAAAVPAGDRIAAEAFTHPGFLASARMLGHKVEPIALDANGMIPEAVEEACRSGIKALYCIPTLQNPTTTVLPAERRAAVVEIAARHGVVVIEDDLFAYFHPDGPPPLASLAPDQVIYVTSVSKTVAAGLRTGYVVAPARLRDNVASAIRATCWMAAPLPAEIASRWIGDGTAARILAGLRQEAAARLDLGRKLLADYRVAAEAGALHLWLTLPGGWNAIEFTAAARRHGVAVAPDAAFRVGRPDENQAIRICLGPPATRAALETGLRRLAELLGSGPPAERSIV